MSGPARLGTVAPLPETTIHALVAVVRRRTARIVMDCQSADSATLCYSVASKLAASTASVPEAAQRRALLQVASAA